MNLYRECGLRAALATPAITALDYHATAQARLARA
jgi:hypothetical protein